MKITYTSDDGENWDSEAECLGWERFNAFLDADRCVPEPEDVDSEDETEFSRVLSWFAPRWGDKEHTFQEHNLWIERRHLYRVVGLLKQAEASE